jgi:hypothetical protein
MRVVAADMRRTISSCKRSASIPLPRPCNRVPPKCRPRPKSGSEPAFRRNEAERVYPIEAAHNPEVAGSNPAPLFVKGAETGPFLCRRRHRAGPGQERGRLPGSDSARPGAAIQVGAERLALRRKRAWRMNTAPTAMTSQSQRLKPSSTPSATVRAMIKVKAAIVPQLLTRECNSATSSLPSVDPVGGFYSPRNGGAQPPLREKGDPRKPTQVTGRFRRHDAGGRAPLNGRRLQRYLTCGRPSTRLNEEKRRR